MDNTYQQILDVVSRNTHLATALRRLTSALWANWLRTHEGIHCHYEYLASSVSEPPRCFTFDYKQYNLNNFSVKWDNIWLFLYVPSCNTSHSEYVGGLPDYSLINPYDGSPVLYTVVHDAGPGGHHNVDISKYDRHLRVKLTLRLAIIGEHVPTSVLEIITHKGLINTILEVNEAGRRTRFRCCPLTGDWALWDGYPTPITNHNLNRIPWFMSSSRSNIIDYMPRYTLVA